MAATSPADRDSDGSSNAGLHLDSMPFQLAEILEEDCEAFAIVDEAASANWPLARAMEQGKDSRREMFSQWFKSIWGKDPTSKWMKVVDTETGEMVAGALWRFVLDPTAKKQNAGSERDAADDAKKEAGDVEEIPPVFIEMGRRWRAFEEDFIGDQPFASKSDGSVRTVHSDWLVQICKSSSRTRSINVKAPLVC